MANFTPQELEEILQQFFNAAGRRQYVGARYVPIFGRKNEDSIIWDNSAPYEPLTIVLYQGNSYTSRTYVPAGVSIDDTYYWALTGNYNAQIFEYQREVSRISAKIDDTNEALDDEVIHRMEADAALRDELDDLYTPWPVTPDSRYGTPNQVLSTKGDGKTKWVNPVSVDAEIAGPLIEDWLNTHPEATTTVLDGSINTAKLTNGAVSDQKLNQIDGVLRSLFEMNSYVIPFTDRSSRTSHDTQIVFNGKECTISGTPTSTGLFNVIVEESFSGQIRAGSTFKIQPTGLTAISYQVFWRINDAWDSGHTYYNSDGLVEVTVPSDATGYLLRIAVSTTFNGTPYTFEPLIYTAYPNFKNNPEENFIPTSTTIVPNNTDIDTITDNSINMLTSGYTYLHSPFAVGGSGTIITYVTATLITQIAFDYDDRTNVKIRTKLGSNDWLSWTYVLVNAQQNMQTALPSMSLNDAPTNTTYLLTSGNSYTEWPDETLDVGVLTTMKLGTWLYQIFYQLSGGNRALWTRSRNAQNTWYSWQKISGGNTYNTTNEFNSYNNSYTITATPTITSDTNNYLAPSGDTTDRTSDILAMLANGGTCRLGNGTYYVSELVMPEGSSIIGNGNGTVIRVANAARFGIKLWTRCLVSKLRIIGADTNQNYRNAESEVDRHGLLWQGTFTESQDYSAQPWKGIISDVLIEHFSGGGITCYDTGYGEMNSLNVCNVVVYDCYAGINIKYWSEYSLFTNVQVHSCHIACVNNGGNNMFANCGFSVNAIGFVIDNENNSGHNLAHGSACNCIINHIGSNTGTGVKIINVNAGFVFSNCQFFYSDVVLTDADGVVFDSCNFGSQNNDINIDGGHAILFSDCLFGAAPTITATDNTDTVFSNCKVRSTGAIVGA